MALLGGAACLGASASPAVAQESRRGAYVGIEQGVAGSSAVRAPLSGNSQATHCDSLLYQAGVPSGTDCPVGSSRELYRTAFDLGGGFAAGVMGGYGWRWIRVEAEYLRQYSGWSTALIAPLDDPVAAGKSREWSEDAPPFARLSDVLAEQAFVNVYVDAVNGSRWTPYFGHGRTRHRHRQAQRGLDDHRLGGGWARGLQHRPRRGILVDWRRLMLTRIVLLLALATPTYAAERLFSAEVTGGDFAGVLVGYLWTTNQEGTEFPPTQHREGENGVGV